MAPATIPTAAMEPDIPRVPSREKDFRRRRKDGADVQPDDRSDLADHGPIAADIGKGEIDLRFDPPPDLAIEAVDIHPATYAIEAPRRPGVPDVWVGDSEDSEILVVWADGHHVASETSLATPILAASGICAGNMARHGLDDAMVQGGPRPDGARAGRLTDIARIGREIEIQRSRDVDPR
jgi:hypothetical protein